MSFPNNAAWFSGVAWTSAVRPSPVQAVVPPPVTAQMHQVWPAVATAPASNAFFSPPPAYPATNAPDIWRRLHPYIAHSPTLCRQLSLMAQRGWSVQWNQSPGSVCDAEQGRLSIDATLPDPQLMQVLAHEASHAFDPPVNGAAYSSDLAYADDRTHAEAVAVVNHLRVRAEIFGNCGVDIGMSQRDAGYYESAVSFSQRHGNHERLVRQVQRMMAWDQTSVFACSYQEAYVNDWRRGRGMPVVAFPPAMVEAQRGAAWAALRAEMAAG